MSRYDASNGSCLVFTFKEGLMSAVAHDLKLRVTSWSMDVDRDAMTVSARFDTRSLRFVTAMKDGRDNPHAAGVDAGKIEKNMAKDVLHSAKFPEATFTSTRVTPDGDGFVVAGNLSLHGTTRPITATVTADGDRLQARIPLHQPDFGIKPFSAMLGTLKVKPDVEVTISVPVG